MSKVSYDPAHMFVKRILLAPQFAREILFILLVDRSGKGRPETKE
jgi:hypothetical protein